MFVYEKGNSLNLTFKGSIPVENPEVVIKGFEDGATLTVNGTSYGAGTREFEGKAKTFVYQKDGKLMITFRGIAGMENPEVTLDETVKGTVEAVVDGVSVTLTYDDEKVTAATETEDKETLVEKPVKTDEPSVEPEQDVTEPETTGANEEESEAE